MSKQRLQIFLRMPKQSKARAITQSAYKGLSTRYREYLRLVAEGEPNETAAIKAGFDRWTAYRWRTRLNGANIQLAFAEYMQAVIIPERIAARVLEGMDAEQVAVINKEAKMFPDYAIRAKYIEMAAKFCGYEKLPETKNDNRSATQINVNLQAVGVRPVVNAPRLEQREE